MSSQERVFFFFYLFLVQLGITNFLRKKKRGQVGFTALHHGRRDLQMIRDTDRKYLCVLDNLKMHFPTHTH